MTVISIQDAQNNPLLFDKFIEENFGLVYAVTRKYYNADEYEDYFQCGCMGLVKAAKKYNPEFETKFSTYAVPMIIGEIKRYRRDYNAGLKVSRSVKELAQKIYYLRGKNFTDEEICQELGIANEDITESDRACQFVSSLSEPMGTNDHGEVRTLEDTLASDANIEINVIEDMVVREKLKQLKGMLSNDYYRAFALYLAGKSQTEIASAIGVSQVQVSRIQRQIKKLCNKINSDYESGKKTRVIKLGTRGIRREKKTMEEIKLSKSVAEKLLKEGKLPDEIAEEFKGQFSGQPRVIKAMLAKWGLVEKKIKPEREARVEGTKKRIKKLPLNGPIVKEVLLTAEVMAGKEFKYELGNDLTIKRGEDKLPCTYEGLPRLIQELQEIQRMKQEAV